MDYEESESLDYRTKFIRSVINDLKQTGRSFVFNDSQLEEVKKIMNVEELSRDGICIYIKRIYKKK